MPEKDRLEDIRQRLEWNIRAFTLMEECIKTNLSKEVCQLGVQNNQLALESLKGGLSRGPMPKILMEEERRKIADDVKWLEDLYKL